MDSSMFDEPNSAMKRLKRNMTLDFGSPSIKKLKSKDLATPTGALLQSPDLQMLKLASPELEKMIIQANGLVTTTPTPTSILFPKYVTHEQELYARGFVDALAQLKSVEVTHFNNVEPKQPTSQAAKAVDQAYPPNSVMSTLSEATLQHLTTITTAHSNGVVLPSRASLSVSSSGLDSKPRNLTNNHISNPLVDIRLPKLEEEPQTVPCLGSSPPLSPINMESQERIKLERKRARNRVAARKCRTRKLERISRLEDRVKDLKGQNSDLLTTATSLREQVMKLKQQIVEHCQSGCQIAMPVNGTAL